MILHTVFVTYNRLELTKRTIESYLETVTVPYTVWVVDNASTDGTQQWLQDNWHGMLTGIILYPENKYPGPAVNHGWSAVPYDATHLHRGDNDFQYLPGWCEEVERLFEDSRIGQIGLRTDEEEDNAIFNVGGNCVIRRELYDEGLRYDEKPWEEYPLGCSEDSFFSPKVKEMGYLWRRVEKPCILNLATGDLKDPYYVESYMARGIVCEHGNVRKWCGRKHEDGRD